jgi:uncharacterized membrane protein YgdD (TMEM256/DUF423 family)
MCQDIPGNYTKIKSLLSSGADSVYFAVSVEFIVEFVNSLEVKTVNPIVGSVLFLGIALFELPLYASCFLSMRMFRWVKSHSMLYDANVDDVCTIGFIGHG